MKKTNNKPSEIDQLRLQLRHTQEIVLLGLFILGVGVFALLMGVNL
jgi:hypothetical protein